MTDRKGAHPESAPPTADREQRGTDPETLNRGLSEEQRRLHEPDERSPHNAAQQDAPVPERPVTIQEEADEDIAHLENPPQAEGPRERNNDAV